MELSPEYTRNRRLDEIGLFVSAHSLSMTSSVQRDGIIDAPRSLDFPPHSDLAETPRVLLLQLQHWHTDDY